VALLLVDDGGGNGCVVLTRRPASMKRHAGQYALPGGRLDGRETAIEAALRETREEVGLSRTKADVLGVLDDYPTRSGFHITPVVVWGGRGATLVANPAEVATIYRIPLADLLHPDVVQLDPVDDGPPILSLALLNNRIFAPTAAMLLQLREVALLGKDTPVDGFGQPRFAWR